MDSPLGLRQVIVHGRKIAQPLHATSYQLQTQMILDPRWKRTGSYKFGAVIVNAGQLVSQSVSELVS